MTALQESIPTREPFANRPDRPSRLDRLGMMEASLERMLNHLPGLAYRCTVDRDYEYTMVFVSKGCETLIGVGRDEIMRHPSNVIESMTIEEDLARMRAEIYNAVEARRSYSVFYRIRLPSEAVKWIWDQGDGVYDADGNCLFIDGIMMDVTEQKERELLLRQENKKLRSGGADAPGLGRLVGTSRAMREMYDMIGRAARSDCNVMLYGETGVGKDLVAQTIHELSGVRGKFIPVNCGAIPEQLLESEFFGHVKGAFSGATTNRPGYLAAADKGTLFMDEIGELPLNLQVKLLRALESRTYTPVGASESRPSHFRLICATNRDLKAMVRQKLMRDDFFYRVHVLVITIPPLRERLEDIPLLAAAYGMGKGRENPCPAEVMAALRRYDWPGNVRELYNTLERYWLFGKLSFEPCFESEAAEADARRVTPVDVDFMPPFFPENRPDAPAGAPRAPETPGAGEEIRRLAASRDALEKEQILAALERCGGKKAQTAASLGVTTRTLQRKLKKHGIGKSRPAR